MILILTPCHCLPLLVCTVIQFVGQTEKLNPQEMAGVTQRCYLLAVLCLVARLGDSLVKPIFSFHDGVPMRTTITFVSSRPTEDSWQNIGSVQPLRLLHRTLLGHQQAIAGSVLPQLAAVPTSWPDW